MSSTEIYTSSSNKALSPSAPSYFPYKFLLHYPTSPPPPPPPPLPVAAAALLPLPSPGLFSPIFHYQSMFIHANLSFVHQETVQLSPSKQFPSSPSPVGRNRRLRRGRKCGGLRDYDARTRSSFGSGGAESSDGIDQMALTVTTTGRYPRIVNSFRKDVEQGCRGGKGGDDGRGKPVVPLSEGGGETTVMIRNIPNKYTRELVIEFLDEHCRLENHVLVDDDEGFVSAYDFVYLPLDLRKKLNLGYAFVNFTDPRAAWRFYNAANGKKWQLFHSKKISQIASARLQGKDQLVDHFENTLFACDSEEFLPVTFSPARDGMNAGSVVQSAIGKIISPGLPDNDNYYFPTREWRPTLNEPLT